MKPSFVELKAARYWGFGSNRTSRIVRQNSIRYSGGSGRGLRLTFGCLELLVGKTMHSGYDIIEETCCEL